MFETDPNDEILKNDVKHFDYEHFHDVDCGLMIEEIQNLMTY